MEKQVILVYFILLFKIAKCVYMCMYIYFEMHTHHASNLIKVFDKEEVKGVLI